jgi:FkbM family methyltransferase
LIDRVPFLEKELFLLRRLVRPGDVCIDVGAAGGAHLFVMAKRAGPSGRVIGVEPRPHSLSLLRWLVRAARLHRQVTLVQAALAEQPGRQQLRIPIVPTRAHFLGSSDDRDHAAAFGALPHRAIEVPTRTLDDIVAAADLDRVDLVKCDVEGAELLVLAGAQRVLDRHRPIVIVEADDLHQRRFDATAQDVLDLGTEHGYLAHRYQRGRLEPVTGVVPDEDDYVLIPSDLIARRVEVRQAA